MSDCPRCGARLRLELAEPSPAALAMHRLSMHLDMRPSPPMTGEDHTGYERALKAWTERRDALQAELVASYAAHGAGPQHQPTVHPTEETEGTS